MSQKCRKSAAFLPHFRRMSWRQECGDDKLDKQGKSNDPHDIMQGSTGGDACSAHDVVRPRSRALRGLRTTAPAGAHYSARWCALQRPLVRTTGYAGAHQAHRL